MPDNTLTLEKELDKHTCLTLRCLAFPSLRVHQPFGLASDGQVVGSHTLNFRSFIHGWMAIQTPRGVLVFWVWGAQPYWSKGFAGAATSLISGKYFEREGRESDIWTGRARRVKGSGSPPITSGGQRRSSRAVGEEAFVGGTIFRVS